MKKRFNDIELQIVYFDAVDIITTSEYATGTATATESATEIPVDPGNGFNGEELPFN